MHPGAKDSKDGIKQWWIPTNAASPTDREIEEVLAFVVARGWLEERQVTSRQRIFAVKADSMRGAAEFLQQLAENQHFHLG